MFIYVYVYIHIYIQNTGCILDIYSIESVHRYNCHVYFMHLYQYNMKKFHLLLCKYVWIY